MRPLDGDERVTVGRAKHHAARFQGQAQPIEVQRLEGQTLAESRLAPLRGLARDPLRQNQHPERQVDDDQRRRDGKPGASRRATRSADARCAGGIG